MFIQSAGNPIVLELYAVSSGRPATVIFEAPWAKETMQYTLDPNQVAMYRPPNFLTGVDSQFGFSGISVSSTSDISVFGINSSPNTCGGFMVFPLSSLGTEYYAVTYEANRQVGNKYPEIGIVAPADSTNVQITFPSGRNLRVVYSGRAYTSGQTIRARINKYESIQIQEQGYSDLTGTYITADNKIAVFSGNIQTDIVISGMTTSNDHIVAQIPSTNSYGTSFGIVPIPNRSSNDVIKVVAKEADTQVTITGHSVFTLLRPGGSEARAISSSLPVYVISTKPILVAQFVESGETNDFGAPSVVIVPPVEQFRNYYVFAVSTAMSFQNYLLLVIDYQQVTGIDVDGTIIPSAGWRNIPNTDLAVNSILLRNGVRHYVRHANRNIRFGAYVYGSSAGRCSYAYSAGSCSDDLSVSKILGIDYKFLKQTCPHNNNYC